MCIWLVIKNHKNSFDKLNSREIFFIVFCFVCFYSIFILFLDIPIISCLLTEMLTADCTDSNINFAQIRWCRGSKQH